VGGAVEWCIHQLATVLASSTESESFRQWEAVKRELNQRGLGPTLQPQLQAMARYFSARRAAAHGYAIVLPDRARCCGSTDVGCPTCLVCR
jgi:hypothetical protein